MGILSGLFGNLDPFAQQGLIAQLFGPSANLNTPTSQPAPPVGQGTSSTNPQPSPGSSGLPAAFRPLPSLFGNSMLGNGLRGGLAGLGSSTGYTGLAALGAGAAGGSQATQERQRFNANNLLAGQQYQGGQQSLIGGNLSNQFALYKTNILRRQQGLPDLTMQDLINDPNLVNQAMPQQGAPGQGQAAPGQPGMGGSTGPQGQPGQSGVNWNDPGDPTVQANLRNDALVFGAPYAQMELDAMKSGLGYQQASEAAKAKGQIYNLRGGSSLYDSSGKEIGRGNPQKTEVLDPNGSGNMVPAVIYPNGDVEISGYANGSSQPTTNSGGNNPGNIRSGQGGSFGQYPSMGAGVDAIDKNLQAYAGKGINTVRGIVSTWAPPNENPTDQLVANAAKRLNVNPDQPLDMSDPNTRAQVAMALMQQENGVKTAQADSSITGTNAGTQPVSDLGPYAKEQQEEWAKRRGEIGEAVNSNIQAEQRFQALGEALKLTQSGAFATEKAHLAALLKAGGIDATPEMLGDPAQVQIALKESVQGVFSQIKSLVGGRVAAQEINLLASASSNPNLQPEANAKIISQAIGAIRYNRDFYDALSKEKNPVDPNAYEIQFQKDHPLQGYIDKAEKELGPLKGMAGAQGGGTPGVNGVPWPQDKPATLGAGANDQATLQWFDRLPIGSWFKNPSDGQLIQKTKERFKGAGQ